MRPLIDQDLSVVFYDLTTIKVHGEAVVGGVRPEAAVTASTNPATAVAQDADAADVRQFGMSKSGLIERQFMLSLVQTAEGLPIAHKVHPGNTAEAETLLPMLRKLLARWPLKRVVLVADRGLLSIDNLQAIEALQAELERQAQATGTAPVKLEYVLAVPAARQGECVQSLHELHAKHATQDNNNWVGETSWVHTDKALKAKTKVKEAISRLARCTTACPNVFERMRWCTLWRLCCTESCECGSKPQSARSRRKGYWSSSEGITTKRRKRHMDNASTG
jgi:hypothetical protein